MQNDEKNQTGAAASLAELDALASEAQADAPTPPTAPIEPATPAEPDVPARELLRPLLSVAFKRGAPLWGVTDDEIAQLSEAWGALIDKWAPGGILNRWGVEIAAALVTFQVFAPRMGQPARQADKKIGDADASGG